MSTSSSYYDIDTILAEEELIPVVNMGDFLHLAHLDPDYIHQKSNHNIISPTPTTHQLKQRQNQQHILPEKTKFKMPLWSIDKWVKLQYIQFHTPKHYNRRNREKLENDPTSIDLQSKYERFYLSGISLINLIHQHIEMINSSNRSSYGQYLIGEKKELKGTLLRLYTGERMRRIFDWTMSHIDDDVSDFTKKLSVMEQKLFQCSAASSHAFEVWKVHGSRRICVSETALRVGVLGGLNPNTTAANTPGMTSKRSKLISPDNDLNMSRKRMRGF
jgi:hypothetical protein